MEKTAELGMGALHWSTDLLHSLVRQVIQLALLWYHMTNTCCVKLLLKSLEQLLNLSSGDQL